MIINGIKGYIIGIKNYIMFMWKHDDDYLIDGLTDEQLAHVAVLCGERTVPTKTISEWDLWCANWLSGKDRSTESATKAASAMWREFEAIQGVGVTPGLLSTDKIAAGAWATIAAGGSIPEKYVVPTERKDGPREVKECATIRSLFYYKELYEPTQKEFWVIRKEATRKEATS